MANLETLELTVSGSSTQATQGIEQLTRSLSALSVALSATHTMLKKVNTELRTLKDFSGLKLPSMESITAKATSAAKAVTAKDGKTAERLISALVAVHHGVLAMSQDIPGLVETSNNLASVKMGKYRSIEVVTSQRSSVESARDFIADKVEACFRLAGADVERADPYPGWKPNMNSRILKISFDSYKALFGYEPKVKAIHAGLECGLFLEKFPGLDMISFGPTLRGVHAPGEKLDLASNEKFVKHLTDVVTKFN